MPAPLVVAAAFELAKFAPQIVKWMTGSDKAEDVAEQVVGIAEAVTGRKGQDAVDAIIADPALQMQFQQSVMQHEQIMDAMYLATVQGARDRDVEIRKVGQYNYRADFMFFLAIAVIGWVLWVVWKDPNLNEYVKGVFTLILGRFTGYLDMIYQFEYGSTRRGAVKDATISDLAKRDGPHG
jgi:hypothetical protein